MSTDCIVLSNAYKNRNVYRMTQPRTPMTYDTVDQLLDENFNMYSRLGQVEYFTQYWPRFKWTTTYIDVASIHDTLRTHFSVEYRSVNVFYALELIQYGMRNHVQKLLNAKVRQVVDFEKFLRRSLENLITANLKTYKKAPEILRSEYMAMEENRLLEELSSCKKTVVFLPEVIAVKYMKNARSMNHHEKVTIGKQVFQQPPIGLDFRGIVLRSVIERINMAQQSGIIQYWKNLFTFDVEKETFVKHVEVVPAPLHGNILVIFVLQFAGSGLSILVFFIEFYAGVFEDVAITCDVTVKFLKQLSFGFARKFVKYMKSSSSRIM